MRIITDAQKQALEDLSAEGLLRGLPIQTAEKDIHITELLRGLSALEVHHEHFQLAGGKKGIRVRHDENIQLVFVGGTCLSKAYGLINRMSEDIDIKVVLRPPAFALKKDRGNRARLKALHQAVAELLGKLGFPLIEQTGNPHIRDSHRYYLVDAGYKTAFDVISSLRPVLKLELIERQPLLPLERQRFGYLYETLAGQPPSTTVEFDCISVAETLAEKVLSLLRRCADDWDGHQARRDKARQGAAQDGQSEDGGNVRKYGIDPTLVRHIYDVAQIVKAAPPSLDAAHSIFAALLEKDRAEFAGQNPEFDMDPVGVLTRTLAAASSNAWLRQQYEKVLMPLVYDNEPPGFDESFAAFEAIAAALLSTCQSAASPAR